MHTGSRGVSGPAARRRATAAPIPRDAPVTSAQPGVAIRRLTGQPPRNSAFADRSRDPTRTGIADRTTPVAVLLYNGRVAAELYSRGFDALREGESFTSAPRTIGESDVATFATLTGDHHPLHTDAA